MHNKLTRPEKKALKNGDIGRVVDLMSSRVKTRKKPTSEEQKVISIYTDEEMEMYLGMFNPQYPSAREGYFY